MKRRVLASVMVVAVCVCSSFASADVIRLDNGDTLNGTVVSVTAKEVTIESEVLGKLVLPRKKVVAIVLGDAPVNGREPDDPAKPRKGETPADVVKRLAPKDFDAKALDRLTKDARPAANPEDVVRQLQREGVPPGLMDDLTLKLPGFGSPKVQDYFNKTVSGLMNGSLTLRDVRKDAKNANDQLKDLRKDLGPDGAALDGYIGILEGFLQKTASVEPEPKRPVKPMATPMIPIPERAKKD